MLEAPDSYPRALRNIETLSIRLAAAIGRAIGSGWSLGQPAYCYVEETATSPTGLRWVQGWAQGSTHGRAHGAGRPGRTAFAFTLGRTVVSGGVTFIDRPDVAATLGDPALVESGFAFPVPMTASDEFGALQSAIRIARPGRGVFGLF